MEKKEYGLSYEEAIADVVAYLGSKDESFFTENGKTKESVLKDKELIERIASEHRHCVNRFGNDREWSCEDACTVEPGIADSDAEEQDLFKRQKKEGKAQCQTVVITQ